MNLEPEISKLLSKEILFTDTQVNYFKRTEVGLK
jgi:hypothetical protein